MRQRKDVAEVVNDSLLHKPCVLVVDDEPAIRAMLDMALRRFGFMVLLAATGTDAVELYRRHRDRIAVVLLDVLMPPPDGPQTLAALREINPRVRCCFMSGSTGDYSAEELLARGAVHILGKPFHSLANLASVLREVAAIEGSPVPPADVVEHTVRSSRTRRTRSADTGGK